MALPGNADVVVVRGFWLDEITGQGVRVSGTTTAATITFTPLALNTLNAGTKTPNLRDLDAASYIKTRQRVAVVDPVTGYFATLMVASNDPDLDAYGGRHVQFQGEDPFVVEVPHDAPTVLADQPMVDALGDLMPDLQPGEEVKAVWLTDLALVTTPTPQPAVNYLTSSQTITAVTNAVIAHDEDPEAHADIRALVTGGVDLSDYDTGEQVDTKIAAHRDSVAPHPAYDDLPSLTLLFENGLV